MTFLLQLENFISHICFKDVAPFVELIQCIPFHPICLSRGTLIYSPFAGSITRPISGDDWDSVGHQWIATHRLLNFEQQSFICLDSKVLLDMKRYRLPRLKPQRIFPLVSRHIVLCFPLSSVLRFNIRVIKGEVNHKLSQYSEYSSSFFTATGNLFLLEVGFL